MGVTWNDELWSMKLEVLKFEALRGSENRTKARGVSRGCA